MSPLMLLAAIQSPQTRAAWSRSSFELAGALAKPTLIDLFAGAGGLSRGFLDAGIEPVYAVEHDKSAGATYVQNFGNHCYVGDIQDVRTFREADVIIGGPPCQGFSPLGHTKDDQARHELNTLWREYLRVVRAVRPKIFVIENVPEFLKSAQFQTFRETLTKDRLLRDYSASYRVLRAVDYGVPQRRQRGFVIVSRIGPVDWPQPTHGPDSPLQTPYVTVRDAIGDLPAEPTDENLHWRRHPTEMSLERYKVIPEGGNRFDLARKRPDLLPACWARKPTGTTDVFGRMRWDLPSLTIRTEFFKPEKGCYLHPQADRPITHREAARLQSFPDDFTFVGSKTSVARQIGNAVPPVLAAAVGRAVLARLQNPLPNPKTSRVPKQVPLELSGDF